MQDRNPQDLGRTSSAGQSPPQLLDQGTKADQAWQVRVLNGRRLDGPDADISVSVFEADRQGAIARCLLRAFTDATYIKWAAAGLIAWSLTVLGGLDGESAGRAITY